MRTSAMTALASPRDGVWEEEEERASCLLAAFTKGSNTLQSDTRCQGQGYDTRVLGLSGLEGGL